MWSSSWQREPATCLEADTPFPQHLFVVPLKHQPRCLHGAVLLRCTHVSVHMLQSKLLRSKSSPWIACLCYLEISVVLAPCSALAHDSRVSCMGESPRNKFTAFLFNK